MIVKKEKKYIIILRDIRISEIMAQETLKIRVSVKNRGGSLSQSSRSSGVICSFLRPAWGIYYFNSLNSFNSFDSCNSFNS